MKKFEFYAEFINTEQIFSNEVIYVQNYSQLFNDFMNEAQCLFQRRPCILQGNAKLHTASNTTAWLCRRRVWVLNWSCLQSRSFTNRKHLVHHKTKIWQWRPRTVEQLESCTGQEWYNIPFFLTSLHFSLPRHLQKVVQRWGNATQRYILHCYNFFQMCCAIKVKIS